MDLFPPKKKYLFHNISGTSSYSKHRKATKSVCLYFLYFF